MHWRTALCVLAVSMAMTAPASEAVRAEADATPTPAGVERAASESEICRGLADRRAKLEDGGIRDLLAMQPDVVAARFGAAEVARVNDYIELSERVLFTCPPGALHAALASAVAENDHDEPPPLPVKGPRRAVARVQESLPARRPATVPLPVRAPLRARTTRSLPPLRATVRPVKRPARTVPIPVKAPPGGASSGAGGPAPFRFPQSDR